MIAWEAWPARRHPAKGVLGAVIVAGSVWGVASWTGDVWLTGLAVVVLLIAVAPFFVPTGYRLTPEGVEIRRPWKSRRRPWDDFRRALAGKELVLLTPYDRRTWLENIRGETLLLEENRGEVLEYVEEMVGREKRSPSDGGSD